MISALLVALGGALGALARWSMASAITARQAAGAGLWPWGTFVVNVLGCLLLGAVLEACAGAGLGSERVRLLLGTGFLGAFTTFSTFGYETLRLASHGAALGAALNVIGSVVAGLVACWCGVQIVRLLAS